MMCIRKQRICWEILGIEPTSEESAIKKAYVKQLKHNRPDKNKEGFIQLRAAYEEALAIRYFYSDEEYEESGTYEDDDTTATNTVNNNTPKTDMHAEEVITQSHNDRQGDKEKNQEEHQEEPQQYDSIELSYLEQEDEPQFDKEQLREEILNHHDSITAQATNVVELNNNNIDDEYNSALLTVPNWREDWDKVVESDLEDLQKDEQLCSLLNKQLVELKKYSLDAEYDFEMELIDFLYNADCAMPRTFYKAYSHFNWESRLNSWESQQYPWSIVQELSEKYDDYKVVGFDSCANFDSYIEANYPTINTFWSKHLSQHLQVKYSRIQRLLGIPYLIQALLYLWLPILLLVHYFNPLVTSQLMREFQRLENDINRFENNNPQMQIRQFFESSGLALMGRWLFDGSFYNLLSKRYYAICYPLITILVCSIWWNEIVDVVQSHRIFKIVVFIPALSIILLGAKKYYFPISLGLIGLGIYYLKTFEPVTTSRLIDILGVIVVTTVFLTIRRFMVNSCFNDSVYEENYYVYSWKTPQLYALIICTLVSVFLYYKWVDLQTYILEGVTLSEVGLIISKGSIDYASDIFYLVSHLFAFIACGIFFFFLRVRGLSYLYIYSLLVGFLVLILVPIMRLIVGAGAEINFIHPVVAWLVIILPFILLEIAVAISKLEFLVPIAGAIIGVYMVYTGFALSVWFTVISRFTYKMFYADTEDAEEE